MRRIKWNDYFTTLPPLLCYRLSFSSFASIALFGIALLLVSTEFNGVHSTVFPHSKEVCSASLRHILHCERLTFFLYCYFFIFFFKLLNGYSHPPSILPLLASLLYTQAPL